MSSSEAQRRRAYLKSTLKNVKKWNELYSDGIIDGDIIRLLEKDNFNEKGSIARIQIRWDSRVNRPVRATVFNEYNGFCGLPKVKFEKIGHADKFLD